MIHVGINLHTTNMVNVALNDNAELLRAGLIPEAYQINHNRRELRELTRSAAPDQMARGTVVHAVESSY